MSDRSMEEDAPRGPREVLVGPSHAAEAGARWSAEAIARLTSLAEEGVAAEVIAQAMHLPLSTIVAKAAELGLPLSPADRSQ